MTTWSPASTSPMSARVTSPAPRRVWREVFGNDPDALPSQSPQWVDAICAFGPYRDASRLYELSDGSRAVLPMVSRTGLGGDLRIRDSMLFAWGFGGPVADAGVTPAVLAAVVCDLESSRGLRTHIRPNPLHAALWQGAATGRRRVRAVPARAQVLDLDGGFDAVWGRFFATTRTQVRKAERLGVQVETATGTRLLTTFHQLLRTSVDRWADQQHEPRALAQWRLARRDPPDKLAAIADHLGDACRISIAWYDGRPAAGVLVLRDRNAHFTRAAMDKALAGPSRASTLLQRNAIEQACAAGCRHYHMGESRAGSGVDEFKRRFGATAYDYAEYYFETLPFHSVDQGVRTAVKRVIGFKDV